GLDPENPADGAQDADGDGYTNLEEFLNGTDPQQDVFCGVRLLTYGGASENGACLTRAVVGWPYRTDRAYTLTTVPPAYANALLVRYAEDDGADASAAFLTLEMAHSGTAVVAYDTRAGVVPAWLADWTPTGETLTIRERGTTEATVSF